MSRGDEIASSGIGRLFRGQTAIDFYGLRRVGLIVAVVVLVVTGIALGTRGLNLGLDFTGGQAWDIPASDEFGVEEATDVLGENDVSSSGTKVQRRTSETNDVVTVQTQELPSEDSVDLTQDFADAAGVEVRDITFSFTSSTWGSEITEAAARALVIFLAIVAVFISLRFEWRMAVAALAAMAHDVVLTVGAYAVLGFEVTPATVIAFLTILGYSLYDTIVVFDRVKENEGKFAGVRMPYEDVVNISMNQVLMRSLNTSLSSILPVVSLLLIGSGVMGAVTLSEFARALLVGIIAGVYSSIFVATPLLAGLKKGTGRTTRRARMQGDELRAAVIGAGVSGRPTTDSLQTDGEPSAVGARSDAEATAAVHQSADKLLTHPPRPRKKRRR